MDQLPYEWQALEIPHGLGSPNIRRESSGDGGDGEGESGGEGDGEGVWRGWVMARVWWGRGWGGWVGRVGGGEGVVGKVMGRDGGEREGRGWTGRGWLRRGYFVLLQSS